MKLILALLGSSFADVNSVVENFQSLNDTEIINQCQKFPNGTEPEVCTGTTRGTVFDGQMMIIAAASQYGCWCDIANSLRKRTNGEPVNDLDTACMDLHHGYNCITIDDGSCDPRTLDAALGEYSLPLSALSPLVDYFTACASANPGNTCGYNTCVVEANFLRITMTPVFTGDQDWIDMWNDNTLVHAPEGTFDYEGTCGVTTGNTGNGDGCGPNGCGPGSIGAGPTKTCCGQYPYRQAYFTDRAQCCDDVISPLGNC